MKKLLLIIAVAGFVACNNSSESSTATDTAAVKPADTTAVKKDTAAAKPADTTAVKKDTTAAKK